MTSGVMRVQKQYVQNHHYSCNYLIMSSCGQKETGYILSRVMEFGYQNFVRHVFNELMYYFNSSAKLSRKRDLFYYGKDFIILFFHCPESNVAS